MRQKATTGAPVRSEPKLGNACAWRPSTKAATDSSSAAVTTPWPPRPWMRTWNVGLSPSIGSTIEREAPALHPWLGADRGAANYGGGGARPLPAARRTGARGRSASGSGRLRTATWRPRAIRSRTASAVRARSSSRSARSSAAVGRCAARQRGCSSAGGRWTTATESRASGNAAGIRSMPLGVGRQLQVAGAAARGDRRVRHVGREALLERRAARWRAARGAARGPRRGRSAARPGRGRKPAQASAAAAAREPAAPPTRVTTTTGKDLGAPLPQILPSARPPSIAASRRPWR